ncbi:hypothetical protein ACWD4G_18445 [Streptomyces sp. NPDC002643]
MSATAADIDNPDTELVGRATSLVPLIREHAAQVHLLLPMRYGGHKTTSVVRQHLAKQAP